MEIQTKIITHNIYLRLPLVVVLLASFIRVLLHLQVALFADPTVYPITTYMGWPCQAKRENLNAKKG